MEEAEKKEKKIIIFIKVFHSKFHIIIPVVQLQTVINVCECVIEGVCWFLSFLRRRFGQQQDRGWLTHKNRGEVEELLLMVVNQEFLYLVRDANPLPLFMAPERLSSE